MPNYAIFLRGINVGGKNKVPMKDLRDTLSKAGVANVRTFLQSGNVTCAYNGSADELKTLAETTLTQNFSYEAYVVILTHQQLINIVSAYPWHNARPDEHRYVLLVNKNDHLQEIYGLAKPLVTNVDKIAPGNQCLYWQIPKGQTLDLPIAKLLAKPKYKEATTMRNLNTLEKML